MGEKFQPLAHSASPSHCKILRHFKSGQCLRKVLLSNLSASVVPPTLPAIKGSWVKIPPHFQTAKIGGYFRCWTWNLGSPQTLAAAMLFLLATKLKKIHLNNSVLQSTAQKHLSNVFTNSDCQGGDTQLSPLQKWWWCRKEWKAFPPYKYHLSKLPTFQIPLLGVLSLPPGSGVGLCTFLPQTSSLFLWAATSSAVNRKLDFNSPEWNPFFENCRATRWQ